MFENKENLKNPVSKNDLQVLRAILRGFQIESRLLKAKMKESLAKETRTEYLWLRERRRRLGSSAMHYQIIYGLLTGLSLEQIVPGIRSKGIINPITLLAIAKSLVFSGCYIASALEAKDIDDWMRKGKKLFLTRRENAARLKELQKAIEPSRRWLA
jgi:hypothetical protein